MKNIGMIVAVEIEAALSEFGKPVEEIKSPGYNIYKYKIGNDNLFVAHSGAGEIAAAMTTQFLITKFDVEFVVNFGVVGGLTPEMKLARTCIVEKAVHYDFDTSEIDNCEVGRYLEYPDVYIPATPDIVKKAVEIEPTLKKVICASADKFVGRKERKEELHKAYNADICEMEAAAIILTCNKNKVPCLLIKTVSDSISGGAEEFTKCVNESAEVCIKITRRILSNM